MTERMHTRDGWNPPVTFEGMIWLRDAETGEDVDLETFENEARERGTVASFETLAASDCECAASWFPGAFAPCDGPHGIQACDGCTVHGDDFDTAHAIAAHLHGLTGRTYTVWYEAEPVIFASKTPRDLNRDPLPWRNPSDGERRSHRVKWISGADLHDPRPEYDHEQHNEPNPILRGVRLDAVSVYGSQLSAAEAYLDHINERFAIRTAAAGLGVYTLAHIDHARRVLTRLAALTEQETIA